MSTSSTKIDTPVYYVSEHSALQVRDGDTAFRAQLDKSGGFNLYKTTDGGSNWSKIDWFFITQQIKTIKHSGDWWSVSPGTYQWYYYEGANTSTKHIPSQFCFVFSIRMNTNRGIALAFRWPSGDGTRIWINHLHDDSQANIWGNWESVN